MAKIKVAQDVAVSTICGAIKQNKSNISLTATAVVELAGQVTEGLEDLQDQVTTAQDTGNDAIEAARTAQITADTKADKGESVSVTVGTSWNVGSGTYPLYYDISVGGLTENDSVNVAVAPEAMDIAVNCGLCPVCETLEGIIRLYAKETPNGSFNIEYWILKGVN